MDEPVRVMTEEEVKRFLKWRALQMFAESGLVLLLLWLDSERRKRR